MPSENFDLRSELGASDAASQTIRNACLVLGSAPQQKDFSMGTKVIPIALCGVRMGGLISTMDIASIIADLVSRNRLAVSPSAVSGNKGFIVRLEITAASGTVFTPAFPVGTSIFKICAASITNVAADASLFLTFPGGATATRLARHGATGYSQFISGEPFVMFPGEYLTCSGTGNTSTNIYGWYE